MTFSLSHHHFSLPSILLHISVHDFIQYPLFRFYPLSTTTSFHCLFKVFDSPSNWPSLNLNSLHYKIPTYNLCIHILPPTLSATFHLIPFFIKGIHVSLLKQNTLSPSILFPPFGMTYTASYLVASVYRVCIKSFPTLCKVIDISRIIQP